MRRDIDITPVVEDYLKVVWSAQEWSDTPVTTKQLAERLGVGASTVSETVRRLCGMGLLEHERYGAISLTEEGRDLAVAMVRRHRLLETYLVERLGYQWDEVHEEAEVLEHAVSDLVIDRMDAALGHPTHDPHGDPIPDAEGRVPTDRSQALSDVATGAQVRVLRVSDRSPDILRYLSEHGIWVGTRLTVTGVNPAAAAVQISVGGVAVELGLPAADAVRVGPVREGAETATADASM